MQAGFDWNLLQDQRVKGHSNHQWIQEKEKRKKTPCAIIKPIQAGLMARVIIHCRFDRAWGNRAALHFIRGIHHLPRTGFGFDAGDMKLNVEACAVIFINKAFTLDIYNDLRGKILKTKRSRTSQAGQK